MPPPTVAPRLWTTQDWGRHDALRALHVMHTRLRADPASYAPSPCGGGVAPHIDPDLLVSIKEVIVLAPVWQGAPRPVNLYQDDGWLTYAYLDGSAIVFRASTLHGRARFVLPGLPFCAPLSVCWADAAFRAAARALWAPAVSCGSGMDQTPDAWAAPLPAWARVFPTPSTGGTDGRNGPVSDSIRGAFRTRMAFFPHLLLGALPTDMHNMPHSMVLYGAHADTAGPTFRHAHRVDPHVQDSLLDALDAAAPFCAAWFPGRFGFAQAWKDAHHDGRVGQDPRVPMPLFSVAVQGPNAPSLSAHQRLAYRALLRDPEGFLALDAETQHRLVPTVPRTDPPQP